MTTLTWQEADKDWSPTTLEWSGDRQESFHRCERNRPWLQEVRHAQAIAAPLPTGRPPVLLHPVNGWLKIAG